jgi:AcrR family transcriptional regulator
MDDVARAIGKGRSSLYYYYKSKDEIFDAVMDIEIGQMLTAMSVAVDKANTVEQKINAFCVTKLQVLREKRAFFKTLDVGMDADALSHFNKTKIIHHNLIIKRESALLQQLLTDGIKKGEVRPMPPEELDTLIFVLLSSLRGIKREMEMQDDFSNIEPLIKTFTEMVMRGVKG